MKQYVGYVREYLSYHELRHVGVLLVPVVSYCSSLTCVSCANTKRQNCFQNGNHPPRTHTKVFLSHMCM